MGVADSMGGTAVAWGGDLVVWGGLVPERGQEAMAAGRLQGQSAGVLTVRSFNVTQAIDTKWRVLIDGIPYQIRDIQNPDQRNIDLAMVVERGVGT